MQGPLISIITANYNKANYIAETIESLIEQTYQNWELILVDDCSTDNSVEIIRFFSEDKRIVLFDNKENKGANFCRNQGIKEAKGEYIIFLDADDLLAPFCLQGRVDAALESPRSNLLIFSMGVFYKTVGDDTRTWTPDSKKPLQDFLQHNLPWSILQPIWKKDFLIHLKGFDESFLRLQDVELNTRALLDNKVALKIVGGAADCFYRIDEGRKNYNPVTFFDRWIYSANKYYYKFSDLVAVDMQKFLKGTLYQIYISLLNERKLKNLNQQEFDSLGEKLLQPLKKKTIHTLLFNLSKHYNLMSLRVPGINYILKKIVISLP